LGSKQHGRAARKSEWRGRFAFVVRVGAARCVH
jgi:hypothetical protein